MARQGFIYKGDTMGITNFMKNMAKKYKEYEDKAPLRRKQELEKLKVEKKLTKAKVDLETEKAKLRKKREDSQPRYKIGI